MTITFGRMLTNHKESETQNRRTICNHTDIDADAAAAVSIMRKGGIILYPTDTVWGIGCDATNADAVRRIYELKRRVDHKAMIVLADSPEMLERHVVEIPEVALQLIDVAIRPTTIIYDQGCGLAHNLLGIDGSIGIRVTSERFSAALCRKLRRPVVSTSANISGQPSPKFFREISSEIINGVDYVATYRRDDIEPHAPSCIIKLSNSGEVKIIRE